MPKTLNQNAADFSADDIQKYIAEARRLRAEAFAEMSAAAFRFLKNLFVARGEMRAAGQI